MSQEPQKEIIAFLGAAASYPHPVHSLEDIETHISHVFLTGEYAYKIKKPVKFDFLDFSSLEKRKYYCEEELRLNSRFAADLYLQVLPVSRRNGKLLFGAGDEVVEYVIQMRQFDKGSLFDELAARGELRESFLLEIADIIARFHLAAAIRPEFWSPEHVTRTINQNLDGCAEFTPNVLDIAALNRLRDQSNAVIAQSKVLMEKRQHTHVRELHGDLHLKNMCIFRGHAALFDGIEFNPQLSNCDVWADLAFFIMDLLFRGMPEDAILVWNHYLQETDDFEGLELLDLYISYRAAIRARISCLELGSSHSPEQKAAHAEEAQRYVALALNSFDRREKKIIAIGGLAGTGKSTLSSILARRLGAVHIRSDAVRKHLVHVPLTERAPQEAYSEEMNKQTYRGLLDRAYHVLQSNRPVILDAVFHSADCREEVEAFAEELSLPFVGIWCKVSAKVAQERVRMRVGDISDADESVVALQHSYPLGEILWHHLDTTQHEDQAIGHALAWLK